MDVNSKGVDFHALDYLSKRCPGHSVTELSQLLLQNRNDARLVEAILGNDLYAASGEQAVSPKRSLAQNVHGSLSPVTHGFGSSPQGATSGGTVYMPTTGFGRVQSGPELGGYSQYDRLAQPQHPSVSRSQSVQHRDYYSSMRATPEYSVDPGQGRSVEHLAYHPSHVPDHYGMRNPHHVEYGGMKTPERPHLELRVPSSGSGYSDWSTTPSSDQSTPGTYRMSTFDQTTPVDYWQPRTSGDYYAPSAGGYHSTATGGGDHRLPSSQDTRGYPLDRTNSWLERPKSGHHHPVVPADPGYSGARLQETQPVYPVGRQQQYGAMTGYYPSVSRPSEPLPLSRQTSHGSAGSNAGGLTCRTPVDRNAPSYSSEFHRISPTTVTPTQQVTSNDAYLQALLLHQSAQLDSVRRHLDTARVHSAQLQGEATAKEHQHTQHVSEYSGTPSEDDLEFLRGEIQSLETSVDDLQRAIHSPQPAVGGRPQDQVDEEGPHWSCEHCSFLNHPALTRCEVCEIPKRRSTSDVPTQFSS